MAKNYPVIVAYSLPGQPGVRRGEQIIMQDAGNPELASKRALRSFRMQNTKGKKNLTYYVTIKPQNIDRF